MLEMNTIIYAATDESTLVKGYARVVGVDPQQIVYLMRMDKFPLTAPYRVPLLELQAEIESGAVKCDQQVEVKLKPTEILSGAALKELKKVEEILGPLMGDDRLLYDPEYRGRMFLKRAQECRVCHRRIRRLYYQYLWGGKTVMALAPQFDKRGGKGKQQRQGTKKRGVKAKKRIMSSQLALPEIRDALMKGAKMYFLSGERTLEEAFMETQKRFFSRIACIETPGKINEILLPPDQLPSISQFRYVCRELIGNSAQKVARRIRQKSPEWEFRGWSRDGVPGPGFRFEIDATKLQIRLVSRFNRSQVLQSSTLYVIVDIWSGAYVGYSFSLENASWALAAKALLNCFTDKKEVFERLGLDYTSDDWPCHHLPMRIAADRAELVSNRAGIVPNTGIIVEIMPSMCPERKGKVESAIKDVKHSHSHRIPGRYPKNRQRREDDGIQSAALTIDELEKIIAEIIVGLNHDPVPEAYIPPEMIEDGETDISHIGLYRWGLEHKVGYTRRLTQQQVITNLMAKGDASLTNRGLYFNSYTFVSPELTNAQTNKRESGKGNLRVPVRYDEHDAESIFFLNKLNGEWVKAVNTDENIIRRKAGFAELEAYREEIRRLRGDAKKESLHRKSESDKKIKQIVKLAEEEAKEDKKGMPKSRRGKNKAEFSKLEAEAARLITPGVTAQLKNKANEVRDEADVTNQSDTAVVNNATDSANQTSNNRSVSKQSIADLSVQLWGES